MKRLLLAALFAPAVSWAGIIPPADCLTTKAVPFKTRPTVFHDFARSDHGRHVWGYCKDADPTKRPTVWAFICKHGVCDLGLAANTVDAARTGTGATQANWSQRLVTALGPILGPNPPNCYKRLATGEFTTDPWKMDVDAAGNPVPGTSVPYVDDDFMLACSEAMVDIVADWPDAPSPAPTPPPAPPPPPAEMWLVKPNPLGGTTRSVYEALNGVRNRQAVPNVRATVSATCGCDVRITEPNAVFCGFAGGTPTQVTECQKQ